MAYDNTYIWMTADAAGKGGWREFKYRTTDNLAAITAADYFSDGKDRAMEFGDTVEVQTVDSLTAPTTMTTTVFSVSAVDGVTGAATIAAPGAIA